MNLQIQAAIMMHPLNALFANGLNVPTTKILSTCVICRHTPVNNCVPGNQITL